MKSLIKLAALLLVLSFAAASWAAADIEINTPGVAALTQSRQVITRAGR
jgi:hypothetical protein